MGERAEKHEHPAGAKFLNTSLRTGNRRKTCSCVLIFDRMCAFDSNVHGSTKIPTTRDKVPYKTRTFRFYVRRSSDANPRFSSLPTTTIIYGVVVCVRGTPIIHFYVLLKTALSYHHMGFKTRFLQNTDNSYVTSFLS